MRTMTLGGANGAWPPTAGNRPARAHSASADRHDRGGLPGAALTLIHTGQAPTRSALTAALGVTRATVGAVTGELRDLRPDPGRQAGTRAAARQGRPSHRLAPDPDGPGRARGPAAPGRLRGRPGRARRPDRGRDQPSGPGPRDPARALAPVAAAGRGAAARVGPRPASARRRGADARSPSRKARRSARSTSAGRPAPRSATCSAGCWPTSWPSMAPAAARARLAP